MTMLTRTSVGLVVLGVVLGFVPNAAASDPISDAPRALKAPQHGVSVTLITGDRVHVPDDAEQPVITPAAGRGTFGFRVSRKGRHLQVVPNDAAGLIASGKVDPRLFDVTELASLGYDDQHRADVPVIVSYKHHVPTATQSDFKVSRRLPGLGLSAVTVAKPEATRFWRAVTGSNGRADRLLDSDIASVWLDGKRHVTLDHSVPQIGAPSAWVKGYTGRDVTVAVIDTGIDAAHPDLASKVAGAANFTEEAPGDHDGHGTHVASIVGSSGASDDGKYKGVAPDVKLLDAKACVDSQGTCTDGAILAAMEWAAVDQHAPIVNMSFGSYDFPGIDPVEQAVNDLSQRYGTLFVVAAGNSGDASFSVASPGSAEAALTVGAVDRDDSLWPHSSRGPRTGDSAVKPDLTAPGVGIVAARAEGTGDEYPPGPDDQHIAKSGTSMATPHVAGTAALLLQEHPGWKADQLKPALMASATPMPGVSGFDQGAGRVDAARAATQDVTTSPANVSFGLAEWPHDDNQILTRTVTYQNSGSTEADLDLSAHAVDQKGATAPNGLFTISPTHLDVPAGGSAKVTVTANIGSEEVVPGEYSGQVEATDGTTVVSTPMGVVKEDERYSISLTHIGRDGAAPDSHVTYLDRIGDCLDLSTCLYVDAGAAGTTTWRVPPGDYDLAEYSTTAGQAGQTLMMQPVLHVATDMSVTLDARNAEPVHLSAPDTSVELFESDLAVLRDLGRTGEEVNFTLGGDGPDPLYSGSIGDSAPHASDLVSGIHGVFAQPGTGDFTDSPVEYDVADFQSGKIHSGIELHPVTGEFAKLNTSVTATSSADHVVEMSAGARPTDGPGATAPFTSNLLSRHVPFTRSRYLLASGLRWTSLVQQMVVGSPGSPCPDTCFEVAELDEPQEYAPAKMYEDPWFRGVWGPRFTQPGDLTPSGIERRGAVRQGDHFAAGITMLADAEPTHMSDPRVGYQPLTLYRDGEVIASSKGAFITADLPADAATYRLDAAAVMPYFDTSTRISSSWTFRSGHVQGTQSQPLPFMAIRYAPALDEHNHAPASPQFSVPVAVERQPGAAPADVTTLTVQVSYDDGATWSGVPLLNSGDHGVITVENRPGSAVSLRATAKDSAGDSVTQTILRAYLVE